MSILNPDFDNLPERVQAVLDASDRLCCVHCRSNDESSSTKLLRCTRCEVAHYCSRTCQKEHFPFHKQFCKSIAKQRKTLEETMAQIDGAGDEMTAAKAALVAMSLGDELVALGYCETDTIAHGSVYYRRALHYYLETWKLIKGSFFDDACPFEDKVLMLLTVLGGDLKMLVEWFYKAGSPRFQNFLPPLEECPPEFTTQGLAGDDILYQCLILLIGMRSLNEYRQNLQAFQAYKNRMQELTQSANRFRPLYEDNGIAPLILPYLLGPKQEGQLHMDILPGEIRQVIAAIRHHGKYSYLRHLRDDIPLTPQHAPNLLRDGGPIGPTLPEFWYLFQGCFFLTPGLNNVLNEFLPEEADNDNNDGKEEEE